MIFFLEFVQEFIQGSMVMIGHDNHDPYIILCYLEELLIEENLNDAQLGAAAILQNFPIFPSHCSCNTLETLPIFRILQLQH